MRKNTKGNKGLFSCFTIVMITMMVIVIFIVIAIVSASLSNNNPYDGSRAQLSQSEKKELDDLYIEELKKVDIVASTDERNNINIDESLKKIHKSKKISKNEKISKVSNLANFMSVYYVEKDQEKINQYVKILQEDLRSGKLKKNKSNKQYLLKVFYMSQVIDNSISINNENEKVVLIDDFSFDFSQISKNLYRGDKKWNSNSTQSNLSQLNEKVNLIVFPKI